MRFIHGFVIFLLLGLSVMAQNTTVIHNVTVIDVATGRPLQHMTVVVKGQKIESVGPSAKVNIRRTARTIDGTGKFLIPGLWDMHTHFTQDPGSLTLFLANGITGVRDMGAIALRRVQKNGRDTVEYVERDVAIASVLKAREQVRSGKLLGPRMFTTGMIVTGPDPRRPDAAPLPHQIVVKTPEEARAAVNKLAELGVDEIKVHARLTRDCFFAIIAEAKKRNLPVVGHTPLALNPIEVSDAGQRSIEHETGIWEYAHLGTPANDESMDPARFQAEIDVFKKNKTYQTPTLINYQAPVDAYAIFKSGFSPAKNEISSPEALDYVVPELALRWMAEWSREDFNQKMAKDFKDSVVTLQKMTLDMHKAGVPILAGTDAGGIFTYPGFSLHDELALLNEGGLSPIETLRSATIRPAQFLGIDKETGSVAAGKFADLVLLNGDPLADIHNTRNIDAIFLRGKLLDRSHLDAMLATVRERSKNTRDTMKNGKWGGE